MNIPVYDQDLSREKFLDGVMSSNGDIIEEAESHGPVSFAWMAGSLPEQNPLSSRPSQTAFVSSQRPLRQEELLRKIWQTWRYPGRVLSDACRSRRNPVDISGGMGRLKLIRVADGFYLDQREAPFLLRPASHK